MSVRYYGRFDTDGAPLGFWPDDVYPDVVVVGPDPDFVPPPVDEIEGRTAPDAAPQVEVSRTRNPAIPAEAVAITEAQWSEMLAHQGRRRWDGKGVVPYEPAAPLPALAAITDRQFGEGLWRDRLISYEEYLAFIGPGVVPPPLLAIIDTLPDDATGGPTPRKVALGLVTGAQSYHFDDPLVDVVRRAQGWSVEHLRERWAAWAKL